MIDINKSDTEVIKDFEQWKNVSLEYDKKYVKHIATCIRYFLNMDGSARQAYANHIVKFVKK